MKIQAFIFDIYNTLLEVGPAPANAEKSWLRLCRQLPVKTKTSWSEFEAGCRAAIAQQHAAARARGVQFPEVCWPDIARKVIPTLGRLSAETLDEFLYQHAQLERTVLLMPGAAETLTALSRRGAVLGLCSNSQPYTLRELAQALAPVGLSLEAFDSQLCFYSFRAGFSKPDPNVFLWLKNQLASCSIALAETLFIGDRLDNDIGPARSLGCRTWHLSPGSAEPEGGDWFHLLHLVEQHSPPQHP